MVHAELVMFHWKATKGYEEEGN